MKRPRRSSSKFLSFRPTVEALEKRELLSAEGNLFVGRLYPTVLNRTPDAGGAAFWEQQFDQGVDRGTIARGFLDGLEYRTNKATELFNTYLARAVDPVGLGGSLDLFAAGGSEQQLQVIILGSAEYFQQRGNNTVGGFLDRLYADVLHRAIDPGARDVWTGDLANGTTTATIASRVVNSLEAARLRVGDYYTRFLGRTGDPGGVESWVSAFLNGASAEAVIFGFIASQEFFEASQRTAPPPPQPVPPALPTFDLDPDFDSGADGDRRTGFTTVNLVGLTSPGAEVTLTPPGATTTADAQGRYTFPGVTLALGDNTFTVRARNAAGLESTSTRTLTRVALPAGTQVVAEGQNFATQTTVDVDLGQQAGTRTLRFTLDAGFDRTDATAASQDTFLVYLVDPDNPTQTLLQRGVAGTALFALTGTDSELTPGLVRFDGGVVEIDVTSLGTRTRGRLVFQLLNADGDNGTTILVGPVTSEVDAEATAGPSLARTATLAAAGAALDLSRLTASADVALQIRNVRFNPAAGNYTAELSLRNNGAALGRDVAAVFPGLPSGVALQTPSGQDANGNPYLSFRDAIPAGGLDAGAVSSAVQVTFTNPNAVRFALRPQLLVGVPNRAPVFGQLGTLTVMPGDCLTIPMPATDPDGDALHLMIESTGQLPTGMVTGDGALQFAPTPGQVGSYQFTLVAGDGILESKQAVTLNVVADPVTTTRLSGVIQDTNRQPLANVPVAVGNVTGTTDAQGRFLLNLGTGTLPGDTLRILGRSIPGNFPFIAEKLNLLLGHDVFTGVNNVVCRPIFLPALNTGSPVNPNANTTITETLRPGEAASSVLVRAGTLRDEQNNLFSGNLSITEVPVALTPAALPANLMPDVVVTIQPGEMVFTQPAPLTFPNRSGWEPGTLMNLWSINPVTGDFDDVGDMRVSADGLRIETISGGVNNSSWHFPAPPLPDPDDPDDDDHNEDDQCEECKETAGGTSVVELHSGALREWHDLVTYQSLGATRGLSLHYDSERADPRPVVHFGYSNVQVNANRRLVARMEVQRGTFEFQVPGNAPGRFGLPGGEHFWKIGTGGSVRVALQPDLSMLPSGLYTYDLTTGILQFSNGNLTGSTSRQTGRILHVNSIGSIFGNGWGLDGLLQVVENPDGSVLLIDGNGGEQFFGAPPAAGQPYDSPPGDFTRLEKVNGRFRRAFKDGTVQSFNADNFLATMTDRNGNVTAWEYRAPGQLTKVTDPVGLETRLEYTGNRVTKILDPAGRETLLAYDADGNLTRVTDPDGASRNWGYDGSHRLTTEVDKRGFREETSYNFAGQVVRALRKDGTELVYEPVQAEALFPADQTDDPATAPSVLSKTDALARFADANGNITEVRLDKQGQAISRRDTAGVLPSVGRDAENLIRRNADGRGFSTTFDYDARGNVTSIRDSVSSTGGTRVTNEGREFWLSFQPNLGSAASSLFISSGTATTGTVEVPGLNFTQAFTTTPGQTTTVTLPAAAASLGSNAVSNRGVRVTSEAPVTVYGLNRIQFTTDGFLGLPVEALGTEYLVMSYTGGNGHFAVVATEDNTDVTITLPRAMGGRPANAPFNVALNRGQVYYLAGADATGVGVSATKRVAVFGGHVCANVPVNATACDHLAEQMPPVDTWGTEFVTVPLATRRNGDTFRFLAATDETEIRVNGTLVATLNRGQFHEQILTAASTISSTKPILVAQYSNGTSFDNVTSDPFMLLVPPFEQFVNAYTVATPATGFATNFVNLVVPSILTSTIRFDGNPIPEASFMAIPGSSFVAAQIPVTLGTHRFTGASGFGLFAYGFDSFDSYGYLGGQSFSPGLQRTFTYDPTFSQVTSDTDQLGRQTLYEIDPANGNLLSATRVVGMAGGGDDAVTRLTYTAQGLVDTETDALGRVTDYDYDARGRVVTITLARGTPEQGVQRFEYDAAGNRTAFSDENGNRTEAVYDALNRPTRVTRPDPDGAGPLAAPVTVTAYDAAGNAVATTDARGNVTRQEYDALGRATRTTDPAGAVTLQSYDDAGNLEAVVDPLGNVTQYRYDARNRRVEATDAAGAKTRYRYDTDDNLVALTDAAGNQTRYAYDARNRVQRITDAQGKVTSFEIDPVDRVVARTDRNGRRTEFAYDDLDHLVSETWVTPGGAPPANVFQYGFDAVGNLLSVTDAAGTLAFTYDARNRLRTADNAGTPGAPRVLLNYAHDAAGNLLSVADAVNGQAAGTTAYLYDALGRVARVTQSGTGVAPKRVDLVHDAADNLVALARFADLAGSQAVARTDVTFDALNRVDVITHTNAASVRVAFHDLDYDAAGRLVRATDVDGVTDYANDPTGQLLAADHASPGNPDEAYTYDANGNRLTAPRGGTRTYGPGNRLLADGLFTYAYDDEGNLTRRTETATGAVRRFEWDYRNRLVRVTDADAANATTRVVTFAYDGLNRRILKGVDATPADANGPALTHYAYDRGEVLLRFTDADGTGPTPPALARRYLYGPAVDQILAQEDGAGNFLWPLTDHLGSVRDVVDNTGALVNHLVYDSFGNLVSQTNPAAAIDFGFQGREFDPETGLYYYRARYYDPAAGRFVGEDPLGVSPEGANPYAFVNNRPTQALDPFGLINPANAQRCASIARRIQNLQEEVARRTRELYEGRPSPGSGELSDRIPGKCPGDDLVGGEPSLSRRGHQALLNDAKRRLAAAEAEYLAFCSCPPPVPVPVPAPQPAPQPAPATNRGPTTQQVVTVVAVVGTVVVIGALIYFSGGLAAPVLAPAL